MLWKQYRGQDTFVIYLTFEKFGMEGELAIHFCFNSEDLFTLSFAIAPGIIFQAPVERVILVSRVQGKRGRLDLIKHSTKLLNDISPRLLLLEALQAIAISLGISGIVGISAKENISSRFTPSIMTAYDDYDHFWLKHGGERISNRAYWLPVPLVHKPISMIKGHHRRRAQRRRGFRNEIMKQIYSAFIQRCTKRGSFIPA